MKRIIGATLIGTLFSLQALADVVVVVSPDNDAAISAQAVKRIFLGKENEFSTGVIPTPVNHESNSDIRREFESEMIGRSSAQISAQWSKLIFTGRGKLPQEVASDAELIELIKQDSTVIGYIDAESVTADVKVVNLD
jgi:ABC-type phosphate transport system substrate-binding protein